ncbi:MAG: beta-galactosidase [Candidatus Omnitrophota bacterium]
MILGVQYYRPPFPEEKYWEDDFVRIKDAGLDIVQLWIVWAWVEPGPGRFIFDDYDRLVKLADKHGLGVILSTIAEVQPYWIHRVVPQSEMVDHTGRKVVSSNREECHFGITPGGCTDHPEVWDRMKKFLSETAVRYRSARNLRGWDVWNELRWSERANGLVCFCEYTLQAFRGWLDDRYRGLDGLNKAWKRRYMHWEEVIPGRLPEGPYTETMAFEHFLTWRANQHGKRRYDLMKGLDPVHPITLHGGSPTPFYIGSLENCPSHALERGNDWFYADVLDGIGCSSFPKWFGEDDAAFGVRIETIKSAARDKLLWLSEVQGGTSAVGFKTFPPVDAVSQQRWIWNGLACGVDTLIFWCWRDEVFGRESGGFGISGNDGLAKDRLAALRTTSNLIKKHRAVLNGCKTTEAEVGVFFSPQSYYLHWAQEGSAYTPWCGLMGYGRALVRKSIPFIVVEEEHLEALSGLKILFLPRMAVADESVEKTLEKFVRNGGVLVCESECGAFNSQGLYRYPEDRFSARLSGIREVGRRLLDRDGIKVNVDGQRVNLGVSQWFTPREKGKGRVMAGCREGNLVVELPLGKGRLVLCGTYFGDAYFQNWTAGFEDFVELMARSAGWSSDVEVLFPRSTRDSFTYVKSSVSNGKRVVFVLFPRDHNRVRLRFKPDFFHSSKLKELVSGTKAVLLKTRTGRECTLRAPECGFSILVES